ncbi:MAG: universal stress protein [Mesorhizobium sp.]|uniref:universal stress protein n=1 Tax=unclassified Mesorhizobium TaxID=325217 RepID=UPI000FE877DD|nr:MULTISPECIES: universal stress protein [unclassified Mesorhizobium]RWB26009.1 MAG: universal stress protein [Mesorhizobium sp.]RWB66907.1 MAG: universal stress protein [Mesorhizobium sp.]RWC24703.1 MAG: universal stress protein [Mesorhizobium sp.]RWD22838.1 MAG: universal stress protein [Mesorhizobium sp.]TGT94829.1 universal stress protein [Mesorhizobium sp. M5C.F.Ca.ET.164.01.1.1]
MSFKTILTVTGPDFGNNDINLTAELCEQVDAHLSVLVAAFAAPMPLVGVEVVSEVWLQERERDMQRLEARTMAVSALLANSALSVDVSSEYSELVWGDEAIGRRARYADLTVIGPNVLADETLRDKTIEGVLFSSGKPLLLVPDGSSPTLKPKHVLVGWDSSIEASRVVRESLDILVGANDVHLTLIDPVEGEGHHGAEPGADAAAYLARHGAKVTVDRLPSFNRSDAEVLRQHAIDVSADLVVMGAYGHSRLRERIFGGVTKSMLDGPSLPVLVAR